jgi:Domain of unknown function (DUF6881)
MKYIKVKWIHSLPDEPVWLYSELNDDQWETRKVELFADGTKGYANHSETCGTTKLSIEPLPSLEDIASDPQFVPEIITRQEFEDVWVSANPL